MPDGEFTLTGAAPRAGKLDVWHEQADPWTMDVELPLKEPLAVGLQVVRPLIPSHLNKTGQSYFRSRSVTATTTGSRGRGLSLETRIFLVTSLLIALLVGGARWP